MRPFGLAVTTSAYFAVDAAGNIYLPGGSMGAALVKMAPDGSVLARWAGFDVVPGQPDTVVGIAIDPASGDVWATDTTADAVVRLAPDLTQKGKWGSTGPGKGQFSSPGGIAIDTTGNIVVADMGNDRIETFTPDGNACRGLGRPGREDRAGRCHDRPKGNVYASDRAAEHARCHRRQRSSSSCRPAVSCSRSRMPRASTRSLSRMRRSTLPGTSSSPTPSWAS